MMAEQEKPGDGRMADSVAGHLIGSGSIIRECKSRRDAVAEPGFASACLQSTPPDSRAL